MLVKFWALDSVSAESASSTSRHRLSADPNPQSTHLSNSEGRWRQRSICR